MSSCPCCSSPSPCCPALTLPGSIHATFENTIDDPVPCNTCIGNTIVLTKGADPAHPTYWYGSGALGTCGETIEVWFCMNTSTTGCQCFSVYWRFSNVCSPTESPPNNLCTPIQSLSCSCAPFFVFAFFDAGTCCNGVNNVGNNIRIHITT